MEARLKTTSTSTQCTDATSLILETVSPNVPALHLQEIKSNLDR